MTLLAPYESHQFIAGGLSERQNLVESEEGYLCSLNQTTLASELLCDICFQFQLV